MMDRADHDEMKEGLGRVDARLEELRGATDDLSPPPELAGRIVEALRADDRSQGAAWEQAWRWSRSGALLAACAALAAVAVAAYDDGRLARSVATAGDVGVASATRDP
jgi:anti-sigma-K factor RskA